MKTTMNLATIILMALTTHPALAGDASAAMGLVTVAMYDANCAKLPARIVNSAMEVLATIPRVTAVGAIAEVKADYARSGATAWCAETKQLIANATEQTK